ncbi:PLP-dependent aminotransferase family protein [Gilvimarinus xylanilyticus]|uniref:PLP-dependent aminotransferase family protein n=1 Tax=Gilvimarinus xylanilyticus TaxID=2944139 RepID=A0A9X2I2E3_9GAMM|nr:PLP-dependent aminotransferase family protein [Gilvimarinus xylanilyticus]MCP8899090.1 PLP-dependent aminotransferase family protein [Gilvimarinus xylanilyticus]
MLYRELANRLQTLIDDEVYPPGVALPGVRKLSQQHKVSVSTAVNACQELERRGLLQAKPRSGYFVCQAATKHKPPRIRTVSKTPKPVSGQERVLQLVQAANNPEMVNLGTAIPAADFLPVNVIEKAFRQVWREQRRRCVGYEFPPGAPELRTHIARHLASLQCRVNPEQVLITNSCQESIAIALKQVTQPGDIVVLESPTYYGLLQVVEQLGLKALEIPTDPTEGLSLGALELALESWPVAACVFVPSFSNPLGTCLSDERKQQLLRLLEKHNVPLVEDDIYGELPLSGPRPRPVKSWDTQGLVYYCSSSSKTLAAGLRVGWLVPGKNIQRAEYLQFINTVSVNTPAQLALAEVLDKSRYQRLIRGMCSDYSLAVARMIDRVSQLFPPDTRISRPAGGFVLWVELPGKINTTERLQAAMEAGVSFAPGSLFSATGKFANCLRINCAVKWDARVERGLLTLAKLLTA